MNNNKSNPVLQELEVLVGNWDMELSNAPFLPSPSATVHGKVLFEWMEAGSYLIMRQSNKDLGIPFATWMISRDESSKGYVVFYYDDRKVSRIYQMSFEKRVWKLWREAPGFFQRFKGTISKDSNTIKASWEMSTDGKNWKHDFDMTYTR